MANSPPLYLAVGTKLLPQSRDGASQSLVGLVRSGLHTDRSSGGYTSHADNDGSGGLTWLAISSHDSRRRRMFTRNSVSALAKCARASSSSSVVSCETFSSNNSRCCFFRNLLCRADSRLRARLRRSPSHHVVSHTTTVPRLPQAPNAVKRARTVWRAYLAPSRLHSPPSCRETDLSSWP